MLVSTALATLIAITGFTNVSLEMKDTVILNGEVMLGSATTYSDGHCNIQLQEGGPHIIATFAHEFAHCLAHSRGIYGHGPAFDNYDSNMHWHLDLEYTPYKGHLIR